MWLKVVQSQQLKETSTVLRLRDSGKFSTSVMSE